MEPPSSSLSYLLTDLNSVFIGFDITAIITILVMIAFLVLSALISGSEVAFFSLNPSDIENLENEKDKQSERVLQLLDKPNKLLATILIANNFVNVAIIVLSSFLISAIFNFDYNPILGFVIKVISITFVIILVGEVAPKVYATKRKLELAKFMSKPLEISQAVFSPLSAILIFLIGAVSKNFIQKKQTGSVDELGHALELTDFSEIDQKEQQILKGIVNFGNIEAVQIMTPRMDVQALENTETFKEIMEVILNSGYSRIPVYKETFDEVIGILFIKDLLPHIDKDDFDWLKILRKPFFVPENKKIDDLLKEFQLRKTHLAIIVDEYGGSSGIVTLEDIIEEIIGEISDEFDEETSLYRKIDNENYLFEAKIPLMDFYKALEIEGEEFEEHRGEAETLAGFILEQSGKIPKKHEKINFQHYRFFIESADKRKIKQIKLNILPKNNDDASL